VEKFSIASVPLTSGSIVAERVGAVASGVSKEISDMAESFPLTSSTMR
jgi:hypothetical protein